jgi:hypothetical protein
VTGEPRLRGAAHVLLLLALLVAVGARASAQRGPRVDCSLEREQCFEGESIGYVVAAIDVEDVEPPDLSGFTDFDVKESGNKSSIRQSFNGRVSQIERFQYSLTPKRVGRLKVPAPTVIAGKSRLVGQELELQVLEPVEQDFVRLAIDVTPDAVYPLRPVTVRLRVFVARIAGAATSQDPIALLSQLDPPPTPMLRVPWVEPPPTLQTNGLNDWLGPRIVRDRRGGRTGGFAINEIAPAGMPSLLLDDFFGGPRYAMFDLEGRPATATDLAGMKGLEGKADRYFVYHLDREITPTRAGTFDFGPVTFKGRVIDSLQDRRVTLKDAYAVGRPARLTVKEVPEAGKPESYTGGVGAFRIAATVAPEKAHVGDPITLTLSVTGSGNLDELAPPQLAKLPEFASAFKVYDASAETKGGARVFTWSLRPLAATVKDVPPMPFSWFDVEHERYVTAKTDPLPIVVEEATKLDPGAIVSGGAAKRGETPELSARAAGLFAHDTDPRHLGDERVHWRAHAAASIALPVLTLAGLSLIAGWQRRHSDPRARRRRSAAGRARERSSRARELAKNGDAIGTAATLRLSVVGAVADIADLPEAGLTARDTKEAIERLLPGSPIASEVGAALERWESLRFAGGGVDAKALGAEGDALLERLLGELSRAGRSS